MSREGVERSAILLLSLGEEEAVEVFRHLGPREVQKLGQAMAKLSKVSRTRAAEVLRSFRQAVRQNSGIAADAEGYVRSVLTKALGSERATPVVERILATSDNKGIESLKWMDSAAVAELIRNEHPQIIATVLVHLDSDQAGEIVSHLPDRQRNDVLLRIATLETVQPAAMRDLNEVLTQILGSAEKARKSPRGGIEGAADILKHLPGPMEAAATAHLREVDAELAQRVQDKMFVFEDLAALDDRGVQLLLREVQSDSLIVALKGTSDQLKEKIFKNMSQRAGDMLRDDLDAKGPVRLSEVEAEQREILRIVRKLSEEGQIVVGGSGEAGLVD